MEKSRQNAKIQQTLVYFDGPQLLTLEYKDKVFIAVAINHDSFEWPFFCAAISREQFSLYMSGQVDLRSIICSPKSGKWYIFDLYSADETGLVRMLRVEPQQEWFPDEGFFSCNHTEDLDERKQVVNTGNVLIDESRDIPDLPLIVGKFSDTYSIYLCDVQFR